MSQTYGSAVAEVESSGEDAIEEEMVEIEETNDDDFIEVDAEEPMEEPSSYEDNVYEATATTEYDAGADDWAVDSTTESVDSIDDYGIEDSEDIVSVTGSNVLTNDDYYGEN